MTYRLLIVLLLFASVEAQNVTDNEMVTTVDISKPYKIRVGAMFPREIDPLETEIGFASSAGAIPLALERIQREQLLPNAQWSHTQCISDYSLCSFMERDTACDEPRTVGVVTELIFDQRADVFFGPPCSTRIWMLHLSPHSFVIRESQCNEALAASSFAELILDEEIDVPVDPCCTTTAMVAASLSRFYNIPMFSWAATAVALDDYKRYMTLSRVISSGFKLGRALIELMRYFNWRRFAFIYTDDKARRKCHSIAEGLREAIAREDIVNVYNMLIDRATVQDEEIDKFLEAFPKLARIAVICLEHEGDTRRLMLRAQQLGLTSKEYVYILPDYVRDQNRSELWRQIDDRNLHDTRDAEVKSAFAPMMMLEMILSTNEELHYFKKQIINKIEGFPFHYQANNTNEQYGSLYSPFLHDAMYLYAIALNKTLSQGGNISDGILIVNNTRDLSFIGASGHVIMDSTGSREPNFVVKGFNSDMRVVNFAEVLMYKHDSEVVNLLIPERMMWESRDGFVPVDTPKCGFENELCQQQDFNIFGYALVAVIIGSQLLLSLTIGMIFYIRQKLMKKEMARMLWQINYKDLEFLTDSKSRTKSLGSLRTITTAVSDETTEALAKGDKNAVHYRGLLCWAKTHSASMIMSSESDHLLMKSMCDLSCDNVNQFMGLSLNAPQPISVWRYCTKGSLEDVIHNENIKLDWFFKYSLIKDLVVGMEYIHGSPLECHGRLKSSNCVVDSRWVLKITDYGLVQMRSQPKEAKNKLWTAPELLRMQTPPLKGTPKGDVFSLAIVIQEILSRDRPYYADDMQPGDIILRVAKAESPPFRPTITSIANDGEIDPAMVQLMTDCWKEDPELRPRFKSIKSIMRQMARGRTVNLMDHALKMMEKCAQNFEQTIADRTRQIAEESKKSDLLLYRILPKIIADRLKSGQTVDPEVYENTTILVADIDKFESLAVRSSALQVVLMLNDLYTMLDDIIGEYDVYKTESLGDAYVVISGAPARNGTKHASEICDLGLNFISAVRTFYIPHLNEERIELRIGVHSGSVIAGVVGVSMPRFFLWGEAVNVAVRMQETDKPSCIQISEETHRILMNIDKQKLPYITKPRGEVVIKGAGVVFTYWLLGKSNSNIADHTSSADEQSLASTNSRVKTEDTGLGSSAATSKVSLKDTAKNSGEHDASRSSRTSKTNGSDAQADKTAKKNYNAAKATREQTSLTDVSGGDEVKNTAAQLVLENVE